MPRYGALEIVLYSDSAGLCIPTELPALDVAGREGRRRLVHPVVVGGDVGVTRHHVLEFPAGAFANDRAEPDGADSPHGGVLESRVRLDDRLAVLGVGQLDLDVADHGHRVTIWGPVILQGVNPDQDIQPRDLRGDQGQIDLADLIPAGGRAGPLIRRRFDPLERVGRAAIRVRVRRCDEVAGDGGRLAGILQRVAVSRQPHELAAGVDALHETVDIHRVGRVAVGVPGQPDFDMVDAFRDRHRDAFGE